jgi:hypothetical protein
MAKVQGFKEQPKERASSPVPQIVLVDTSRPEVKKIRLYQYLYFGK